MKGKKVLLNALTMAAIMAVAAGNPVAPMAASQEMDLTSEEMAADLADADLIDFSQRGSLTIYKYDITSAENDHVYQEGTLTATGEADSSLESTMADYSVEGVGFSYLFCGVPETYTEQTSDGTGVQLVYEIPVALATILQLDPADAFDLSKGTDGQMCKNTGVLHYTGTQIQDALAALLEEDNVKTVDALEEYVKNSEDAVEMPLTDENGLTQADNMELGLYLLVETKVPEEVTDTVNPWFASLPFTDARGEKWLYDMTCYPKNQTGNPNLDKLVRNATGKAASEAGRSEDDQYLVSDLIGADLTAAQYTAERSEYVYSDTTTASEGDVLDYILVSKLPHISTEATYLTEYTFTDELSKGIQYNRDVQLAFYADRDDAMVNNTSDAEEIWDLSEEDSYTQDYVRLNTGAGTSAGGTRLTVSFTEKGLQLLNTTKSDYYIVVYYTGTLNEDDTVVLGDEGNPNDVSLEWRRTSDTYYNTLEDRCYVYSFALNLKKEFSDEKGNAQNVQFVLYDESDGYYVTAGESQIENGEKVYHVSGKTLKKGEASVFSPSEDGSMLVEGIEADTYQMTEIRTDKGYSLLRDPISVTILSTEREVNPSACGYVGNDGGMHIHTDACRDATGALVCGMISKDEANGRTIGKQAMYVGEIQNATATVDGEKAEMEENASSAHAVVQLSVINNKAFLLPQTGGKGLYVLTIAGVLAMAAGCMALFRRGKRDMPAGKKC